MASGGRQFLAPSVMLTHDSSPTGGTKGCGIFELFICSVDNLVVDVDKPVDNVDNL